MKTRTAFFRAWAALGMSVLCWSAHAQPSSEGQRIAQQGVAGAAACASCHGAKGEGNAAGGFPRIAGLPARYFSHQMQAFANGSRNNPVMTPIAKALDKKQADALADYYAALSASASPSDAGPSGDKTSGALKVSAAAPKQAERLASVGDESRQLQACANCHGPGGSGEPPVYPYLAGQHASYLVSAMKNWQGEQRKTDPSGQMPSIASKLKNDEINGLAAWYAGMPPPPPAASRTLKRANAPAPSPTARSASTPSPASAGASGTEQGGPQSGGNQGAGGTGQGETGSQPR